MPLPYREAVRLIKNAGGIFAALGANHDQFLMPWGTIVTLPRHKKDFSPGVEADIRKRISGERR